MEFEHGVDRNSGVGYGELDHLAWHLIRNWDDHRGAIHHSINIRNHHPISVPSNNLRMIWWGSLNPHTLLSRPSLGLGKKIPSIWVRAHRGTPIPWHPGDMTSAYIRQLAESHYQFWWNWFLQKCSLLRKKKKKKTIDFDKPLDLPWQKNHWIWS